MLLLRVGTSVVFNSELDLLVYSVHSPDARMMFSTSICMSGFVPSNSTILFLREKARKFSQSKSSTSSNFDPQESNFSASCACAPEDEGVKDPGISTWKSSLLGRLDLSQR